MKTKNTIGKILGATIAVASSVFIVKNSITNLEKIILKKWSIKKLLGARFIT
ncbi:hypothetical protein JTS96_09560 [Clostridium botulinum]|nr:hypothetical protein [Clostridium botulinum]MCS4477549.1 hypothetical protein [Clostridium botulinum]MCS4522815.1 hypothetical protein [Clostridium botulinum]